MDVILITFVICLLGVMVTVLLFVVAMRPKDEGEEIPEPRKAAAPPEGFFMDDTPGSTSDPEKPTNTLLARLERHIRIEHQAAETFLRGPSAESLHAPPDPPRWQ